MAEQFGYRRAVADRNPLHDPDRTDQRAFNGDLAVKTGTGAHDMRQAAEFRKQGFPVFNAVGWIAL